MSEPTANPCDDLDEAIDHYTKHLGYRLDMIFPADNPREALVSSGKESVRIVQKPAREQGRYTDVECTALAYARASATDDWIVGRAGMEYRDLIPDRLGGKVIASHIRLTKGGEVPDYVHYHKVDFQMIYCKNGRIKVVYEDQGPPFWLETGDCVLQPPEIRHRVLECTAGAEVIEVSMPAEHETWVEHDITLPTNELKPDRDFNGQRFLRYQEALNEPFRGMGYVERETGLSKASNNVVSVSVSSFEDRDNNSSGRGWFVGSTYTDFVYVLDGELEARESKDLPASFEDGRFAAGDCFVLPQSTAFTFDWSPELKLLLVRWAA